MKRVTIRKNRARFLGAWISNGLLAVLDKAVRRGDTDRSKLVRHAVEEKVKRTGMAVARTEKKP